MGIQTEDAEIAVQDSETSAVAGTDATQRLPLETPSASALGAFHLEKTYGKRRVVDNVSLHVEQGEVVGLLGANGAGKYDLLYDCGPRAPHRGTVLLQNVSYRAAHVPSGTLGLGYLPRSLHFSEDDDRAEYPAVLETMGMPGANVLPYWKSCCKSLVSPMCATRVVMRCQVVKEARNRAALPPTRSTFSSTSLLLGSTQGVMTSNVILYLRQRGIGILVTITVRETLGVRIVPT